MGKEGQIGCLDSLTESIYLITAQRRDQQ